MKCFEVGTLQGYIDGELLPSRMEQVRKHLDTCETCQLQFEALFVTNEWEASMQKEEMPYVVVDVQKAWENVAQKTTQKNVIDQIKGVIKTMKNRKRAMTVAAAALLLVVGIPAVASGVYSLFNQHVLEDGIVNNGLTNEKGEVIDGTKNGVFLPLDEKITDQGITVHLTDLYVADSRVSVHYTIEDEEGNLLPVTYNTDGLDLKYDGKVDGKQVEAPEYWMDREAGMFSRLSFLACEDNLAFELMKDGQPYHTGIRELGDPNDVTVTFVAMEDMAYPVTLDIHIEEIGGVKGTWQGQIEIAGNKIQ